MSVCGREFYVTGYKSAKDKINPVGGNYLDFGGHIIGRKWQMVRHFLDMMPDTKTKKS